MRKMVSLVLGVLLAAGVWGTALGGTGITDDYTFAERDDCTLPSGVHCVWINEDGEYVGHLITKFKEVNGRVRVRVFVVFKDNTGEYQKLDALTTVRPHY